MLLGQENPCGPLALEIWHVRPSVGFSSFSWYLSGSKICSLSHSPPRTTRTTVMTQIFGSMESSYTDHLRLFTNLVLSSLKVRNFLYIFFFFAGVFSTATAQQEKFEAENRLFTHRYNEGIPSNYGTHLSTLRMALYLKSSQILKMRFHVSSLLFY